MTDTFRANSEAYLDGKAYGIEIGTQKERERLLKALDSYELRKKLGLTSVKGLKTLIKGEK